MCKLSSVIVCAASIAIAAQVAGAETVDKSLAADPRGEVEISNVSGRVHVIGWERAEVQVNADLGADVQRLEFQRDGERVAIKVVIPSGRHREGEAELTVHVPRDSKLSLSTVSADQTIEEVRGAQRLSSVNGDIETQVWSGDFRAENVSGDIVAKGKTAKGQARKGRVRLTNVSGSITIENLGDDLEIETVSGDMEIHAQSLARARIKTTNGNLQLASGITVDSEIDAEAINGELEINLDGAIDAEFEIETFNGRIDNCFGPKSKRTHEYGPGRELRFKEGEGHGSVRIKTMNGRISLCRTPKAARRWKAEPRLYAAAEEESAFGQEPVIVDSRVLFGKG